MLTPHQYYNAINRFYQGYYPDIKKSWEKHQSWKKAWNALTGNRSVNPEREWGRLEKNETRLILKDDEQYPELLRETPDAPFGLYVKGALAFKPPTLAIVGTRRATSEGLRLAQSFSQELSGLAVTIVSGLALGIDQAAHWGAVKNGGTTIAVMANGLDDIYPQQNRLLAEKIIESGGALVSEYPIGTPSLPHQFLERNRIISGLSLGTLVIEAPFESGALVTARCAVEQNREVFVIPGPLINKNYVGSHQLLKNGAALVTEVADICLNLNLPLVINHKQSRSEQKLTAEQLMVLNYIEAAGHSLPVDKIIELTKLEPHVVNQTLASLVINDIIKEYNGRYSL